MAHDCVLEPDRAVVRELAARYENPNRLRVEVKKATGRTFYNTSNYEFANLLADADGLADNLADYIDRFSADDAFAVRLQHVGHRCIADRFRDGFVADSLRNVDAEVEELDSESTVVDDTDHQGSLRKALLFERGERLRKVLHVLDGHRY